MALGCPLGLLGSETGKEGTEVCAGLKTGHWLVLQVTYTTPPASVSVVINVDGHHRIYNSLEEKCLGKSVRDKMGLMRQKVSP